MVRIHPPGLAKYTVIAIVRSHRELEIEVEADDAETAVTQVYAMDPEELLHDPKAKDCGTSAIDFYDVWIEDE